MEFEFDPRKSAANEAKHGIDFVAAQALWNDTNRAEVSAKQAADEPRFLVIGMIDTRYWTAIVTYRDERVRIISIRRSREEEIRAYEG
jgi:uncharacterized DUF497 family protein